jgi:hypothetical protein
VQWLHAHNVDTITIVGYMTSNCDLATAAEAEVLGFATEILSDATGAIDLANEAGTISAEALHTALMVLLQSNFAAVSTTAQWIEAVRADSTLPKSNQPGAIRHRWTLGGRRGLTRATAEGEGGTEGRHRSVL